MKYFFVVFMSMLIFTLGFGQEASIVPVGPIISWKNPTHDFGDIIQGDRMEISFKFTNTGSTSLIITNVEVTCGCTTPKGWPRDPIPSGGKGELIVAFNSVGKYGRQNKVVKIISNSVGKQNQVMFTANVLTKE